ncbi:EamA family transporter [Novosphingobium sp. FSY-8]|uniref:EamA family transporter n=1 Tax=Novosphingobium ovatum TaxID=1908523 RepID=A0ABW9XEH7_9SPHN|nr:EamA family transporter [Novosphingobium ovatum]NBC36948.1 EamA family transporter [Novosphingobium ovatum]
MGATQDRGLSGRALAGFVLLALIWGSTWLVIKDQISATPPSWTVTWRFAVGSIGMIALTIARRESLRLPPGGMVLAAFVGLAQFFGNFQMVYRAEHYVTSGLVAVIYALLMVPNAALSRLVLGTRMSGRFVAGSLVAMAGIALLMVQEWQSVDRAHVLTGVGFALGGLACASVANVAQATQAGRRMPVVPMLTWAMLFGTLADALFALVVDGAPVIETRPGYWAGVTYLALVGSVIAFPVYFALIRAMGAGRAAYNGVAVPVVAMALSTVFEGYHWSALSIGGSVLAMLGLVLALSGRR